MNAVFRLSHEQIDFFRSLLAAGPSPEVLTAHLTGLAPASYRLRWQVLVVDGHITRGEIPFRVGGP